MSAKEIQVAPRSDAVTSEYLQYDEVMQRFDTICEWLSKLYFKYAEYYPLYAR
jgi:pyruvate-formate lyase